MKDRFEFVYDPDCLIFIPQICLVRGRHEDGTEQDPNDPNHYMISLGWIFWNIQFYFEI